MSYIMQGDQNPVFFTLSCRNDRGEKIYLTDSMISKLEIRLGSISKTTPEVSWSSDRGGWEFPITQEESFSLPAGKNMVQMRVLFPMGEVVSTEGEMYIIESISKNIL